MLGFLNPKNWFRQKQVQGAPGPLRKVEPGSESITIRRFDAVANNRLNRQHWINAHGNSINVDLADLPTLMARCAHEAANNPLVYGALETLETDVVGRNGPRLQVVSDDDRFNEAVERSWRDVWAMPDPTGQIAGPENLRLWVRLLNVGGSFLNVFENVRRPGPVTFGWRTVHPRRLTTPIDRTGDRNVRFGIEFNDRGRPLRYFVANGVDNLFSPVTTTPIRANMAQHRFIADEPEQLTGYPALTSCLETIADLREYDHHVMEAAKHSAAQTPFLEAWDPASVIDPEPLPAEGVSIQVGEANAAPLGWKWTSLQPTQPSALYIDYRHERIRELGLALGMPLMMVLLSSAGSNFASAHYDGAVYLRRIRALQSWFERRTLNELLEQVISELVIAERLSDRLVRPATYSFRWTWETPPYVNPEKQRKADRIAVEDGALPLDEYSASLGLDFDEVVSARERINSQLDAAGLPRPPINHGSGTPSDTLRQVADDLEGAVDASDVTA